eukprot:927328-Rhodomonas_salina.1
MYSFAALDAASKTFQQDIVLPAESSNTQYLYQSSYKTLVDISIVDRSYVLVREDTWEQWMQRNDMYRM